MVAPPPSTDPSPSPSPAPSLSPPVALPAPPIPPVPIHASVSVGRWITRAELSPGAGQVLAALWSGERDPFAPEGRVTVSRALLAAWTGLALASLPRLLARLREVGAVDRVHVTPHGTTYRLLRPEHGPTDHELNPFAPSPQTQVVAAAAELATKRVMARLADDERRAPESGRRKAPRVKPSSIALALESMAGIEHARADDGTPRPSTRYSGEGAEHVAAAQRWISKHGMQAFADVCERARGMELPELTTPKQRLMLFARPRALAFVLGQEPMSSTSDHADEQRSIPAAVDARREVARSRALAQKPDATGEELDAMTEWFLR